jgi:hypothetical protein
MPIVIGRAPANLSGDPWALAVRSQKSDIFGRLSNTLTTDFCIEAVEEAITHYGAPEIFNADQVVRLPALNLPVCCNPTGSKSAWMAKDAGAIKSLWKGLEDR